MSEPRDAQPSAYAWLNGREKEPGSLAYGEVVVPEINVWEQPGSLPRCGKVVGKLPHGSRVNVLGQVQDQGNEQTYYEVSADDVQGWVSETLITLKWSCFTFLGTLSPARACTDLDISLDFNGMSLLVKKNGFAIVTEGAPSDFESVHFAASRFISRITNALAPLITIPLRAEFSNWVEIPSDYETAQRTVGFLAPEGERSLSISNEQIETAHTIVPLMSLVPYLDLALSDFFQALEYPQHASIFLARAIESIENHFADMAKHGKGVGKETVMQELLGVKRNDVEYVTKRANESHRRHATRDGTATELPADELAECYHKTSNIIVAFVTFLTDSGL
jgi:hypothetical protein